MPSLFAGLGVAGTHDSLNLGPSPHQREVFFLIDGLGADLIAQYAQYAPSISAMRNVQTITTAFPSTTATSLATLTTGELPGAHGMLGYTVRVPRSGGRILNALKWDERVDPTIWQPIPTLFERASSAGIQVSHVAAKRYADTGFTRAVFRGAHYRGANITDDLIGETKRALEKSPAFVYLYVADVDAAGHSDGVGSDKWLAALSHVDAMVYRLQNELPQGTRLWISADHGMINAQEKIVIGVDNQLRTNIATIAGEPRARHLYLENFSPSAQSDAISLWEENLSGAVVMHTRESAIRAGLFGAQVSEDAADRIGDIIAIAQGSTVLIDPEREKLESAMVGHHGGDSVTESSVPLLTKTL